MIRCSNCHEPRETALYKVAMRRQTMDLCAPCHASLSAIGLVLVPCDRRETDVQPIVERRRPAWLDRITARADDSWRVA